MTGSEQRNWPDLSDVWRLDWISLPQSLPWNQMRIVALNSASLLISPCRVFARWRAFVARAGSASSRTPLASLDRTQLEWRPAALSGAELAQMVCPLSSCVCKLEIY